MSAAARPDTRATPGTAGGRGPAQRAVYLLPGQLVAPAAPAEVVTILGSCIAVCLHDVRRRAGGINHYLLPHHPPAQARSARFGSVAIRDLVDALEAAGSHRGDLRARVFGGAGVVEGLAGVLKPVGLQNAVLADELLARERIAVVERDVGGTRGRRLVFRTDDGSAHVTLL